MTDRPQVGATHMYQNIFAPNPDNRFDTNVDANVALPTDQLSPDLLL